MVEENRIALKKIKGKKSKYGFEVRDILRRPCSEDHAFCVVSVTRPKNHPEIVLCHMYYNGPLHRWELPVRAVDLVFYDEMISVLTEQLKLWPDHEILINEAIVLLTRERTESLWDHIRRKIEDELRKDRKLLEAVARVLRMHPDQQK